MAKRNPAIITIFVCLILGAVLTLLSLPHFAWYSRRSASVQHILTLALCLFLSAIIFSLYYLIKLWLKRSFPPEVEGPSLTWTDRIRKAFYEIKERLPLLPKTEEIVLKKLWRDAKSLVQEKAQEFVNVTPAYKVLHESGPDHDKHFTVGIFFGTNLIAEGKGQSKQEAEQKAAEAALKVKNLLD